MVHTCPTYSLRSSSFATIYYTPPTISKANSSLKDGITTTIVLDGDRLGAGSYWMLVRNGSNTFNISLTHSNTTTLVGEAPLPPSTASERLERGTEYVVTKVMWHPLVGADETIHQSQRIAFTTPPPPSFTEVKFEFTNSLGTGCIAILTGNDLVVGTEYKVKLNTSHTFSIAVKSSARAESSETLIGFEGSLAYSTDILIETIEPTDEVSGAVLMPSPITRQTPTRPNVSEIFVDTETGHNDWTCGDFSRPCSTMDVAWKIMRTLGIMFPTFSLRTSTSLSSQMTIGSGLSVLIQNGTNNEPSLHIPSSTAESATSALIVVSSALLNIQNIDIVHRHQK
ncbi:hypothetical protein BLNAU_3364 [Blattamonas nauphoetae]|uniref:Uncharacterized protein n=1 Tax=Blattamonas nauphoetae TaxID=2049346 RepID=A0ABQ9YD35_9EUKA|nr:hypothetical protein BLNAU_3364 [Blattamonas nauphoetae]